MRYVVFSLALVGGIGCGLLGWGWNEQLTLHAKEIEGLERQARQPPQLETIQSIQTATTVLLIAFPVAVAGGLVALNRYGFWAGPLLLACGIAPGVFTFPLMSSTAGASILELLCAYGAPVTILIAGGLSFWVWAGKKKVVEVEEPEVEAPVTRKKPAIKVAEPPYRPLTVRVACPKCQTPLKITNPEAGKRIQCPRDGAILAVTPEAIARAQARRAAEAEAAREAVAIDVAEDEAEILEEEEEPAPPPVKKKGKKKQDSMAGAIVAWILLVGGAAAFSILTLMGKLTVMQ